MTRRQAKLTGFECIPALKALGEETRLQIARLLFKAPLGVNELAVELDANQYNVSKHLRIMREAGLVEVRKEGKQRLYFVSERLKSRLSADQQVLDLGCCTFRLEDLP